MKLLGNQFRNMEIIKKAITIRFFEEGLLELYAKGGMGGTTHTYLGQELIASVVLNKLSDNDYVISNHRCHGHFIAYSGKYKELLYEIVGDSRGVCGGRGGSQHISYKKFISNGVLGNLFPVAAGLSYQLKEELIFQNDIRIVNYLNGPIYYNRQYLIEKSDQRLFRNAGNFSIVYNNRTYYYGLDSSESIQFKALVEKI